MRDATLRGQGGLTHGLNKAGLGDPIQVPVSCTLRFPLGSPRYLSAYA